MLKAIILLVSGPLFAFGTLPPRKRVQASGSAEIYRGQPFEYVVRLFSYLCCVRLHLLSGILLLRSPKNFPSKEPK